jgi:hypothetical protein
MIRLRLIDFIILTNLFMGCAISEVDSEQDLINYISNPDHRLTRKTESNGYQLAVTFKPTDLLVLHETSELEVSDSVLNTLRRRYSGYHYFVLSLSRANGELLLGAQEGQFGTLMQTLSFGMSEYVTMTTSDNATITVSDFILNKAYGLNGSTDLLFVFDKTQSRLSDWVQFNLNEFGLGIGNHRFRFSVNDLESAPKIKFRSTEN